MSGDRIEFVYFDLGNVLVSFDPDIACNNVVERFGVDFRQAKAAIFEGDLQDRFEHGEVTSAQFAGCIRMLLDLSADQVSFAEILDAVSDMFTPITSMTDIVRAVSHGCRMGILSNTCRAHWEWIRGQNWPVMDGDFAAAILSYQVGAMKPDPRIYAAAEAAAGVAPSRILFLDDRAENVQGAIDRGWQAAQCLGGSQAVDALRRFGVLS